MSVFSFSNRYKTEEFHPIVHLQSSRGRQLLFFCFTSRYWVPANAIITTGFPLIPSSLVVLFGLNLFYLLSYCFTSTNQPEGSSFKNKNVPNKFSTVPSKK